MDLGAPSLCCLMADDPRITCPQTLTLCQFSALAYPPGMSARTSLLLLVTLKEEEFVGGFW